MRIRTIGSAELLCKVGQSDASVFCDISRQIRSVYVTIAFYRFKITIADGIIFERSDIIII
jgi:hypothetical protein